MMSDEEKPKKKSKQKVKAVVKYVVAPNRSILCKRGMVKAGMEVTEAHFNNGQQDLDRLVDTGVVVKL
jgi:hypothetical protein